ncbi:MAG: preprotein translocase subunit YajC [Dehalococcoidales bacterium]|jgi:preprotein translocase subunit YajC
MKKIGKIGLVAGLLISVLVFFNGCLASATTTTPGTEAAPASFWAKYGIFFFLIAIFALFYFIMIRPQRKRQKEHQQMMSEMKNGDRVITAGGIYGTIQSLGEDSAVIKVEGGTTLRVARGSLAVRRDETQK